MKEFGKKPYLSKNYDQMMKRTTDKQVFEQTLLKQSEMKKPYQDTTYPEAEQFFPSIYGGGNYPMPWFNAPDSPTDTISFPDVPWLKQGAVNIGQAGIGAGELDCNGLWQKVMAKYRAGGYDQGDGKWTNKSWVAALHDYTVSPAVDKNGKPTTCPLYYHCFPGKVYDPTSNCESCGGSSYPCVQYTWNQSCGYTLTWACAKTKHEPNTGCAYCGHNCTFPCMNADCDHAEADWNLNKETICADYINGKGAGA